MNGQPALPELRPLAEVLVPEMTDASEAEWKDTEARLTRALLARPAALRRQVALFVRLLDVFALARHGRTIRSLSFSARTALLARLERSPLLLIRRGVWGLRTLVMLGWYGRPAVQQAIGYRAQPAGWGARR